MNCFARPYSLLGDKMKRIFTALGVMTLVCFSFYYTEQIALLARNADPLMKEILNVYEKKNIKKETFTQTTLFELTESEAEEKTNPIEEKIKQINPLEMTPMEALNYLYELKKEVTRKE